MRENGFFSSAWDNLRTSWKDLIVADLVYKLVAFIVLTPIFSVLLNSALLYGGNDVLSDVDIIWFFAGPFGCLCGILLGAVWLAILALEQTSLLAILAASKNGKRLHVVDSLRFAAKSAPSVLRITARLMAFVLLLIVPFSLFTYLVYYWTISDYDINYYLEQRPLRFKVALGVAIGMIAVLVGIILRLGSGWFIALPLVLFERVSPNKALVMSRRTLAGNRFKVLFWLVIWLSGGLAIYAMASFVLGGIGDLLVPVHEGSLAVLAGRVGILLIVITVVSNFLNLLGTIGFALVLFHAYQVFCPGAPTAMARMKFGESRETSYLSQLTRLRITAFCIIGGLLAALIGSNAINSLQLEDRAEIMAHRGASKVAPENSLSAVRKAIEAGADWVEIDVQETVDGEVVVIHDSDLMKIARNKIKIWDATLAELQEIDIGSLFAPEFSSERVPTLGEVLALCHGKIGVIIELKYYGHDQHLEQRVVDIVEQNSMENDVMVMSLKPDGVRKLKSLRPQWKCGVLLSVSIGKIEKFKADFLAVNANSTSRGLVSRAHKAGMKVFAWTVDDAPGMSMLMNRGVDGILTNRPEVAREVLRNRSEMSVSERLMVEIAALFGKAPPSLEQ